MKNTRPAAAAMQALRLTEVRRSSSRGTRKRFARSSHSSICWLTRRSGSAVTAWQTQLNTWLKLAAPTQTQLTPDGTFGAATQTATEQLQTARLIGLLRTAGMSLREIRRFLALPAPHFLDAYERRLEAELLERRQVLHPPEMGTPQGGLISPVLLLPSNTGEWVLIEEPLPSSHPYRGCPTEHGVEQLQIDFD